MKLPKKQKVERAILFVKISKESKDYLESQAKQSGYCLNEYVDAVVKKLKGKKL